MNSLKNIGVFLFVVGAAIQVFVFYSKDSVLTVNTSSILGTYGFYLIAASIGAIFASSKIGQQIHTMPGRVQFGLLILVLMLALSVVSNLFR